jgi:hypothetical protein
MGIEEKSRLTYRFLKRKLKEYEQIEHQIRQLQAEVGVAEALSGDSGGGPIGPKDELTAGNAKIR